MLHGITVKLSAGYCKVAFKGYPSLFGTQPDSFDKINLGTLTQNAAEATELIENIIATSQVRVLNPLTLQGTERPSPKTFLEKAPSAETMTAVLPGRVLETVLTPGRRGSQEVSVPQQVE